MASNAKTMASTTTGSASTISLDSLVPNPIAPQLSPTPPKEISPPSSGIIDSVFDTAKSTYTKVSDNFQANMSEGQERQALEKGYSQAKSSVEQLLGENGITGEMSADLFKEVGKQAASGKVDLNKIQSVSEISSIVNSLKGSTCMGQKLDTNFTNSFLNSLAKKGFELSLADLFACLKEELLGMGVSFLNTVKKESLNIVKDSSMGALKGAANVLGDQTKALLPDFTSSLTSFKSTGDTKEDYNVISSTLSDIDTDWLKDDSGKVNISTLENATPDAKKAIDEHGTEEETLGLSLANLF